MNALGYEWYNYFMVNDSEKGPVVVEIDDPKMLGGTHFNNVVTKGEEYDAQLYRDEAEKAAKLTKSGKIGDSRPQ